MTSQTPFNLENLVPNDQTTEPGTQKFTETKNTVLNWYSAEIKEILHEAESNYHMDRLKEVYPNIEFSDVRAIFKKLGKNALGYIKTVGLFGEDAERFGVSVLPIKFYTEIATHTGVLAYAFMYLLSDLHFKKVVDFTDIKMKKRFLDFAKKTGTPLSHLTSEQLPSNFDENPIDIIKAAWEKYVVTLDAQPKVHNIQDLYRGFPEFHLLEKDNKHIMQLLLDDRLSFEPECIGCQGGRDMIFEYDSFKFDNLFSYIAEQGVHTIQIPLVGKCLDMRAQSLVGAAARREIKVEFKVFPSDLKDQKDYPHFYDGLRFVVGE